VVLLVLLPAAARLVPVPSAAVALLAPVAPAAMLMGAAETRYDAACIQTSAYEFEPFVASDMATVSVCPALAALYVRVAT
jgi:hypothetical protein